MIAHNKPTLGLREQQAANEVLNSGWLAAGKQVSIFENEVCSYHGLPEGHAVALSSGSAALLLAMRGLNWTAEEVLLPVYTCSSLRHAANLNTCKIRYIDCYDGPNASLQSIDGKAIIPHMYGIPQNLNGIPDCIEDCAQAIGSLVNNNPVGTQARASVFSFYATKLMTSGGQGGMVLSRDIDLINEIRDLIDFDCRQDDKTRFNLQLTELQAAIGRVQLSRLSEFVERRQSIFERYTSHGIKLLDTPNSEEITPVRFRAILKTPFATQLIVKMAEKGIKCIIPIEQWELLDQSNSYPHAKLNCENYLSLPLYPELSFKQVDYIAQSLFKSIEELS